jgi:hypothetical protein
LGQQSWKLKIFEIAVEGPRHDLALLLLDALAARRPVEGHGPWIVTYRAADTSEAFALCAEDLEAIDPRWVEVLDFVAIPPRGSGVRAGLDRGSPRSS